MKRIARLGLIGAAVLASAPAFARPGGSFVGMGDLPGGQFHSVASAVSADGSVVVGASHIGSASQNQISAAARWTPAQGIRPLAGLFGTDMTSACEAISGDGRVIAGSATDSSSAFFGFVWSQADGLTIVTPPPIAPPGTSVIDALVHGLSHDGSVGAGSVRMYTPGVGQTTRAFRWTPESGAQPIQELDAVAVQSTAVALSGDGNVITGVMRNAAGLWAGYRWSEATGVQLLQEPASQNYFEPNAISRDGAEIIGSSRTYINGSQFNRAYRWSLSEGLVELPSSGAGGGSHAIAISGDRRLIVGHDGNRAAIWRGEHSRMSLGTFLGEAGLSGYGDWITLIAADISDDGHTIVGFGLNPQHEVEGFVATIPPHCPGDADRDGAVSFADISAILTHWQAFGPQGDANDDFIVDFNDITETLTNWRGECP